MEQYVPVNYGPSGPLELSVSKLVSNSVMVHKRALYLPVLVKYIGLLLATGKVIALTICQP